MALWFKRTHPLNLSMTRAQRFLYVGYVVVVACLLWPAAQTLLAQYCPGDCNWTAPGCLDPCDTYVESHPWLDGSCPGQCCDYGVCFIKDRVQGQCGVAYCYNSDYGLCVDPAECGF